MYFTIIIHFNLTHTQLECILRSPANDLTFYEIALLFQSLAWDDHPECQQWQTNVTLFVASITDVNGLFAIKVKGAKPKPTFSSIISNRLAGNP